TGHHAHGEAAARAGVAEIEAVGWRQQRANARAVEAETPLSRPLDMRAERLAGTQGRHYVFCLEQPFDLARPNGEKPEQKSAVRDRFVARHADSARKRTA